MNTVANHHLLASSRILSLFPFLFPYYCFLAECSNLISLIAVPSLPSIFFNLRGKDQNGRASKLGCSLGSVYHLYCKK
jgi:hypothetical protein